MQGTPSGKKRRLFWILVIPTVLLVAVGSGRGAVKPEDVYKQLEIFAQILSLLQDNYVEEVKIEEVIQGAVKGMLASLDPHSSYLKPEEFRDLQVETEGSFGGIGIEIAVRDSLLTVVSPIEGTPAFAKGIKAGDKILRINGESAKDMSLVEAVNKLRGKKGSTVILTIQREGWGEPKDVNIVRDVIPIVSVKEKLLEPGYGYIRITNFQSNTARDVKKAIKSFENKGEIQGLILDLRNNPGGLLDQAVKVSDLFLTEGVIVSTQGRIKDQNFVFYAHGGGDYFNHSMVVLVNEGSASASEIVAGAIQDHKRGLILGAQTFGKGSVQTIIPMTNGAGLRLTTARYYTPKGTSIQAKGIVPDVVVPSQFSDEVVDESKIKMPPRIIREKDLKHHIRNGNELLDGKVKSKKDRPVRKEAPESFPPLEEEEAVIAELPEDLSKDNQLNTALTVLKGLRVLGPPVESGTPAHQKQEGK